MANIFRKKNPSQYDIDQERPQLANPQDQKPENKNLSYWKGYVAAFASGGLAGDLIIGALAYKNILVAAEVTTFSLRAFKIVSGGTAVVLGWSSAIPALAGSLVGIILWYAGKYVFRQYRSN